MTTTSYTPESVGLFARLVHLARLCPYQRHGTLGGGRTGTTLLLPAHAPRNEKLLRIPDSGPRGEGDPRQLVDVILDRVNPRDRRAIAQELRALAAVAVAVDNLDAAGWSLRTVGATELLLGRDDGARCRLDIERDVDEYVGVTFRTLDLRGAEVGRGGLIVGPDCDPVELADLLLGAVLAHSPTYVAP